jgi:hypothetical protein
MSCLEICLHPVSGTSFSGHVINGYVVSAATRSRTRTVSLNAIALVLTRTTLDERNALRYNMSYGQEKYPARLLSKMEFGRNGV